MSKHELIEQLTQKVLEQLGKDSDGRCADCTGGCAASCSDKVRTLVQEGLGRVSFSGPGAEVPQDLSGYIDHTLLKPDATAADIDRLCDEAMEYRFAAVCFNPFWVKRAANRLRGSQVKVASVVGFPLGANATDIKVMETRKALRDGAREIDMVLNVGALKEGEYDLVRSDIARVAEACREVGAVCKVILETALLNDEEKVIASSLSKQAKAHFVKTSTGFGPGGATAFDVALMRETVGVQMGVKASGGIKDKKDAEEMIAAGATRIGASAGISIVKGGESHGSGY